MLDHPSDSAMYKKLLKQILYEKARMEVMRGESVHAASKKYGLPDSNLRRLLYEKSEFKYTGKGKKSKVFTEDEELALTQRLLEISDGGRNMTINLGKSSKKKRSKRVTSYKKV